MYAEGLNEIYPDILKSIQTPKEIQSRYSRVYRKYIEGLKRIGAILWQLWQ